MTSVYIAGTEPHCGRSLVGVGMAELLAARSARVGYFRPVVTAAPDPQTELMRGRYTVAGKGVQLHALTSDEARDLIAKGAVEDLEKRVLATYRGLEGEYDSMIVEGLDFASGLDSELDARLANALGCPVLAVVGCAHAEDPAAAVRIARETLARRGCDVLGLIASRVPVKRADAARAALADAEGGPVPVIAEHPELTRPTVAEVASALDAQPLAGDAGAQDRDVRAVRIAAMGAAAFLEDLEEGTLAIVPGDRTDILTASLAAAGSPDVPALAGIVITADAQPAPAVAALLRSAPFPVLSARSRTDVVAAAVAAVTARLGPETERRVATALGLFAESVDAVEMGERLALERPARMTPAMFEYEVIERAKEDRRHIVLPEGEDDRVLQAADILLRRGVVYLTILGPVDAVRSRAAALGLDLSDARFLDPATSPQRDEYARRFHELRKHRGVTEEIAYETVGDVTWFGTFMLQTGEADGLVSGAAHTTADRIRPAFQLIKARPGVAVVSSVFLMCMPDRVLVFGDCAVNPKPNSEELADIAIGSAETAWSFGVEPRVAMLSYSTGTSAKGPDVTAVRDATELARERRPDIPIEGPIQYDAAVEPSVAEKKMPESDVAGRATVLVFPDLESGNVTYKAVQRSSGAVAIGPVLQGLRKPVNDLSRGCLVPDIVSTVVITAIQAQEAGGRSTSRLALTGARGTG